MKEVKESTSKTYISRHGNYGLAFIDKSGKKRKYQFVSGELLVDNADDIKAIDAEYDKRYLVSTDENGKKIYGGDMKFVPNDEFEKSRLHQTIKVKTKAGKIYEVTEADLIEMVEKKEAESSEPKKEKVKKVVPPVPPVTTPAPQAKKDPEVVPPVPPVTTPAPQAKKDPDVGKTGPGPAGKKE